VVYWKNLQERRPRRDILIALAVASGSSLLHGLRPMFKKLVYAF
jgi:hypothetical protein